MENTNLAPWANFFMATTGASAALAGLVIVAVSVNINHILKFRNLPARAGATIAALMQILVTGICGLIPGIGHVALGGTILLLGVVIFLQHLAATRLTLLNKAEIRRRHSAVALFMVLGQVQEVPLIVSGGLIMAGRGSGLYWLAGGVIGTFVLSVLNAWVLLIEILR